MAQVRGKYTAGGLQFNEGATTHLAITPSASGGVKNNVTVYAADGAIAIRSHTAVLTKATAAAMTLAAPTAGAHDGVVIDIISTTAQAHTVTYTAGFNGGGTSTDVGTFGTAAGNGLRIVAYGGVWYTLNNVNVTLA